MVVGKRSRLRTPSYLYRNPREEPDADSHGATPALWLKKRSKHMTSLGDQTEGGGCRTGGMTHDIHEHKIIEYVKQ